MAEVGTILAVIQITGSLITACKHYIKAIRDAPADLRQILFDTSILNTTLENLHFLARCHSDPATLALLSKSDGILSQCRETVGALLNLLPYNGHDDLAGGGSRKRKQKRNESSTIVLDRLAWALKKSRAEKLLQDLRQHRERIILVLTTELAHDVKEVKARTTRIEDSLSNIERRDFYERLQRTDPSPLHNTASGHYEKGTGEWIFRTPEWSSWLSKSGKRCFWIYGIPGSGKTILISHIINHIENSCKNIASNEKVCSTYYYCYFGNNQNEAAPMLRWVISQLCRISDVVSSRAYALVCRATEPKITDLLDALEDTLDSFNTVYLAVDALDETNTKTDLLSVVHTLATESRFQKLRLLVASREYPDIEEVVKPVSISISMSHESVTEDIRTYLESALRNDRRFSNPRWTPHLKQLILDLVPRKANGMFRWAACQLDLLWERRAETSIIETCLEDLPPTLYDTYERIFDSIEREHWPAVQSALRWTYLHRELYAGGIPSDTLVQAVCYETCRASSYFYDEDVLRGTMGCLLRLSTGEPFKAFPRIASCPVFSFAHYTVFEFLTSSWIDGNQLKFFKLSPALITEPISTLLEVAIAPTSYGSIDTNNTFTVDTYKSFTWYSAVSSVLAIATFPNQLAVRNDVHPQMWKLLNPTEQHFPAFQELCIWSQDRIRIMSEQNLMESSVVEVKWLRLPPAISQIGPVFHLASLDRGFDLFGLISALGGKAIINNLGLEMVDLLASHLFIETDENEWFRFTGSFQAVLAEVHVLLNRLNPLEDIIHSFIEQEVVDNAKLLLLRVCANFTNPIIDEEKDLLLMHLLEKVAPDSMATGVSALQIAVACCDYRATRLLLDHGADPNFVSTSCGTVWHEECSLAILSRLHRQSPLQICQDPNLLFTVTMKEHKRDEAMRRSIEALLIEKGAISFELVD